MYLVYLMAWYLWLQYTFPRFQKITMKSYNKKYDLFEVFEKKLWQH